MLVRDGFIEMFGEEELNEFDFRINTEFEMFNKMVPLTFEILWLIIGDDYYDCYDVIGVYDSAIREKIFIAMAKYFNISYDMIYNRWMKLD